MKTRRTIYDRLVVLALLISLLASTAAIPVTVSPVSTEQTSQLTQTGEGPTAVPLPPSKHPQAEPPASIPADNSGVAHPGAPDGEPAAATEVRANTCRKLSDVTTPPPSTNSAPAKKPAGFVPPKHAHPANETPIEPSAAWSTIMREDFEGTFPPETSFLWNLYDQSQDGLEYLWGASDYNPHNGLKSAWLAAGGADQLDPSLYAYPPDANSWMVYGPFDLTNTTNAQLLFYYSNDTISGDSGDHGWFGWYASKDGENFCGTQAAGTTDGWVYQNFNLTTVPTLGNLTGQSSVYIAFNFQSDETENANTQEGAFLDDVLLQGYLKSGRNLSPFQPEGWSSPVVPASAAGTHALDTLYARQGTYFDSAVQNEGDTISTPFKNCLYIDDVEVHCWQVSALQTNAFAYEDDWLLTHQPPEGDHVLKLVVDVDNVIDETNEDDNTWESFFTWEPATQSNLLPYQPDGWDYPIVPASVKNTNRINTLDANAITYIDWAVANEGMEIVTPFRTCLYIDDIERNCWDQNNLLGDHYTYELDWILSGSITPGAHKLKLVADPDGQVAEFDEADNTWEGTFAWSGFNCGDVVSALDLSAQAVTAPASAVPPLEEAPYRILLKSRAFTPPAGVELPSPQVTAQSGGSNSPRHWLIQLQQMPSQEEIDALAAQGIHLLDYIPDHTWWAAIDQGAEDSLSTIPNLRWAGPLAGSDRIAPALSKALGSAGSKNILLTVYVFADISDADAQAMLASAGANITQALSFAHRYDLTLPADQVPTLLSDDRVQWVDFGPPPAQALNDCIRYRTRVEDVQSPPYGLNGAGIKVGIWDTGVVQSHLDFGSRLHVTPPERTTTPDNDEHATHVAGTIAGNGAGSFAAGGFERQWRGMAPSAEIYSWSSEHPLTDLNDSNQGIVISNNSWGYSASDGEIDCSSLWGSYAYNAPEYDQIVHDKNITAVFAAGNERDRNVCGQESTLLDSRYGNVLPPSTGKNVISVGASESNTDATLPNFTSWGPTQDGRIKPDLVAPGCKAINDMGVTSTAPGDGYAVSCGTSLAAPAVSGISALVYQQFKKQTNRDPRPSTIKALLIDGAKDLTGNGYLLPGPDYASGYGRVDAKSSIDLLKAGAFVEGTVANGGRAGYSFSVPSGTKSIKLTLAWDDTLPDPAAAKALVNDLDLTLISPSGTVYLPWVLDPEHPQNPATRGADSLNNVEQVSISNPPAGVWKVRVKGTLVDASGQEFSLAGAVLTSENTCYTLTKTAIPSTGGTIAVDTPPNCNSSKYQEGTVVTLTATAKTGFAFDKWSGDASGSSVTTSVTMTANRSIQANFVACYRLTTDVSPAAAGKVGMSPTANCGDLYRAGTTVTLTASTENLRYKFFQWAGALTGTKNPETVVMNGARSVTAVFLPQPGRPPMASPADGAVLTTLSPVLSWSNPTPAASTYDVEIASDENFTAIDRSSAGQTSTSFRAMDLTGEHTYYWHVRGINAAGGVGEWSQTRSFNTPAVPPVLTAPVDGIQQSSLRPTFQWEGVPNAQRYDLQIATSATFSTVLRKAAVTTASYTPSTDLPYPGKVLYWRVRTITTATGPWSAPSRFVNARPPSAPGMVAPANYALINSVPLKLDWSNCTYPTGTAFDHYQVQVSADPTFGTVNIDRSTTPGMIKESQVILTETLDANAVYYWRVRAVGSLSGMPQYSRWSSNRMIYYAIQPFELTAPDDGYPSLDLRPTFEWTAVPGATSYTIQFATKPSFSTILVSKTASTNRYTPTSNLPKNRLLYWRVRANKPNGVIVFSASYRNLQSPNPPTTPTLRSPVNKALIYTLTPKLDWTNSIVPAGTTFNKYVLQVSKTPDFSDTPVEYDVPGPVSNSQYVFTEPLVPNAQYYWRVRAVSTVDETTAWTSVWTSVFSFRTAILAPELEAPADQATGMSRLPSLSWKSVDGATSYTVQISTSKSFSSFTARKTTSALSFTLTSALSRGKTYYWRVRANGPNGPSMWSGPWKFTVQ